MHFDAPFLIAFISARCPNNNPIAPRMIDFPAYVLKINPAKNTVMLGDAEQLKAEYMLVEDINVIDLQELLECHDRRVVHAGR